MKANEIKIKDIKDGDIIYVKLDIDINGLFLGSYLELTGEDAIFIIDDSSLNFEGEFLVNGGHIIYLNDENKVYKIGHYSELLELTTNKTK